MDIPRTAAGGRCRYFGSSPSISNDAQNPWVDLFTPSEKTPASLIQEGYTYVVMSPLSTVASDRPLLSLAKDIPGALYQQQIPDSPAIRIYRLSIDRLDIVSKRAPSTLVLATPDKTSPPTCAAEGETFCWLTSRFTNVTLQDKAAEPRRVRLSVMTPWTNQEVVFTTQKGTQLYRGTVKSASTWTDITFTLPANVDSISVVLSQVHSLASRQRGTDTRRLGLALKAPSFEPLSQSELEQQNISVLSAYPEPIRLAIADTLTQELEAPADSSPSTSQELHSTPQAPEAQGSIYTLLQSLNAENDDTGSAPTQTTEQQPQAVDIPNVQEPTTIAKQQEEFRKKFLDTILAATPEES